MSATLSRQAGLRERLALQLLNVHGRLVYLQFIVSWLRRAFVDWNGMPARLLLFPRFLRSYCGVGTNRELLRFMVPRLRFGPRRIVTAVRNP